MKKLISNETVWCEDIWRFGVRYYKSETHDHQVTLPEFDGTRYIIAHNCAISTDVMKTNIFGSVAMQTTRTPHIKMIKNSFFIDIMFPGLQLNEDKVYHIPDHPTGNLSYMDGGTNSTAIEPARKGLPVVNYVHFPEGMSQTLHTHPSQRIGLVLSGTGAIELGEYPNDQYFSLAQGTAFWMNRNELHNFMCNSGEDVTLFVFAPDSGMGPTDEFNPLKARTYIEQSG